MLPFGSMRNAVSPSLFQIAAPTLHQYSSVPKSSPHPDLTVTVVLDIVENDGDALLEVFESDSSLCTATGEQISGAPETMNVDVTFHGVGTCILSFDAFGQGEYIFNIVLPSPIALTSR